jgi:hypothetical protein
VSPLSGKCGNLNVSQPCGPSRPVTGIALPLPLHVDVTHQNAGHHNIKPGNKGFIKVAKVNLKEREHLGHLGINRRIILKCFNKQSKRDTGFNLLRIGSSARLL